MSYSLAQAAQAAGAYRSTILRAIKAGKISAQRDAQGAWRVEAVELHRIFPPTEALPSGPQHAHADAQGDAVVAQLRAQLAEMRNQRDIWQAIAERLALRGPLEPVRRPLSRWAWMRLTG
jgi:hypothetical protein